MIRRLDLADYGKFRRESLHFGPCTIVTGPNEAGKTTVFDALFDALCAGSRHEGRPVWKALAGRYGALRRAELTWEEGFSPLALEDDQFLEIFAIRGGDASVNAAGAGSWERAAEARLLTSGLNPAQFSAAMIDRAESSRKGSIKARGKELNKLIKELEPQLAEFRARRDAIFAGEAETVRLEGELGGKNAALADKRAELAGLDAQAEELSLSCRLSSAEAGIKALRDLKEVRDQLAGLTRFAFSELPGYRALVRAAQEAEMAANAAAAALAEKRASAAAAKAALDALVAGQPLARKQNETAAALTAKIAAFTSAPPRVVRAVSRRVRFGSWAAAAALAVFVAWSGHNLPAYAAAAVIIAAGVWVGLQLSIKETLEGPAPEEIKAFLDGLAAEWTTVSDEKLAAADVEAARAFLAGAAASTAAAADSLKARAGDAAGLEGAVKAAELSAGELRAASAAAADKALAWLRERGCASEDEYQQKLAEHEKLSARAGDILERVRLFKEKYHCLADEEIRDRLFMEKEALDHKGVDPAKADEPALERLKARAEAVNEELRVLESDAAKLASELEKARAVAGARLEGLPERVYRAENAMAEAREELAGLELQARGYMLAAEVFNRLAEKSTAAFDELGREVTATLSRALPEQQALFVSFDAAEAAMKDAGGSLRPVRYLSSGAKDLFMLAARLTLAKKARVGPGGETLPALLVLDDPFYTLDAGRTQAALRLLADFQKETGWQLIILSKDFTLPGMAREAGLAVIEQKLI